MNEVFTQEEYKTHFLEKFRTYKDLPDKDLGLKKREKQNCKSSDTFRSRIVSDIEEMIEMGLFDQRDFVKAREMMAKIDLVKHPYAIDEKDIAEINEVIDFVVGYLETYD